MGDTSAALRRCSARSSAETGGSSAGASESRGGPPGASRAGAPRAGCRPCWAWPPSGTAAGIRGVSFSLAYGGAPRALATPQRRRAGILVVGLQGVSPASTGYGRGGERVNSQSVSLSSASSSDEESSMFRLCCCSLASWAAAASFARTAALRCGRDWGGMLAATGGGFSGDASLRGRFCPLSSPSPLCRILTQIHQKHNLLRTNYHKFTQKFPDFQARLGMAVVAELAGSGAFAVLTAQSVQRCCRRCMGGASADLSALRQHQRPGAAHLTTRRGS